MKQAQFYKSLRRRLPVLNWTGVARRRNVLKSLFFKLQYIFVIYDRRETRKYII